MNNQIINKLQDGINQIDSELSNNLSEQNLKIWKEQKNQIERTFKQFDSDQHFIIATGMLKAGKSTLIDLLARSTEASLVGFGIDTTLRPALIKMSDDENGRIKIYYPKEGKSKIEAMQSIVDELRGLSPKFHIEPRICELDQEHLRNILCLTVGESKELSDEPILVIVEVPKNSDSQFFNNNCVLLDMPGLDSGYSEQSKDGNEYKAFFDECDLLLFIQSSVAPINEKAGEYLRYIGQSRNISTYRLIQNVMNAKYWLKNTVTDKEQSSQAENGLKVFLDKIGQQNSKIHPNYVNLGMAYDSILGNKDDIDALPEDVDAKQEALLNESLYMKMEENFINDIRNNGKQRRLDHCCDTLANKLKDAEENISNQLKEIEDDLNAKKTEQEAYSKKIRRIRESYETYNFSPIQFSLSKKFEKQINDDLINEFENIRNSIDYENQLKFAENDENVEKMINCKATVLESFLNKCSSKGVETTKNLFVNAYLDELVHTEDGKDKTAIEYAQSELIRISNNLEEDGIKLNGNKISAKTNKIGELDKTFVFKPFEVGEFEVTRALGFLWETKGTKFNKDKTYSEIVKMYKNQIEEFVNRNSFAVNKVTDLIRSQIKEDLEPQLAEAQIDYENLSKQIKTLENDKLHLKDAQIKLAEFAANSPKSKELEEN